METNRIEKRRAPRFPIPAPAIVRDASGKKARATVVNISSSGILVNLEEPLPFWPADEVMIEIDLPEDPEKPLPAWGVARVVRVEGSRIAVELTSAGFHPLPAPHWPEEW